MPTRKSLTLRILYPRLLRQYPAWVRYVGTTAIVGLFFLARLAVPVPGFPFLMFFPALFLSAVLFGAHAGFYAATLGGAVAAFVLIEPHYSFDLPFSQWVAVLVYLVVGYAIAALVGALRTLVAHVAAGEREKALLLDELAHRTKNNLQMIASLLTLQARGQAEPTTRSALEEAAARVHVIARMHERLQPGGRDAVVDMRDYLEGLGRTLGETLSDLHAVAIRVAAEPVQLDAAAAAPVGLIVNELVTNAFKYAFPGEATGTVEVTFRRAGGGRLEIVVRDDGVGLPVAAAEGLGSRLTRLLIAQLDGEMTRRDAAPGCVVVATFPEPAAQTPRGATPLRDRGPVGMAG